MLRLSKQKRTLKWANKIYRHLVTTKSSKETCYSFLSSLFTLLNASCISLYNELCGITFILSYVNRVLPSINLQFGY